MAEQIDIVATVEKNYGVGLPELQSPSRSLRFVRARSALVYLYRRNTGLTLAEVGRILGGRTPATVRNLWDIYLRENKGK